MIVVPCSDDNVNPIYLQTTTLLGLHYSGPRCDSSIHQNKDFDITLDVCYYFLLLPIHIWDTLIRYVLLEINYLNSKISNIKYSPT